MQIITKNDILEMFNSFLSETLHVMSPEKGGKKKIIISKKYKIKHNKSGLMYTVLGVDIVDNKPYIRAESGDGKKIVIMPNEFKLYRGM